MQKQGFIPVLTLEKINVMLPLRREKSKTKSVPEYNLIFFPTFER